MHDVAQGLSCLVGANDLLFSSDDLPIMICWDCPGYDHSYFYRRVVAAPAGQPTASGGLTWTMLLEKCTTIVVDFFVTIQGQAPKPGFEQWAVEKLQLSQIIILGIKFFPRKPLEKCWQMVVEVRM
ncbi:hypothetical protein JAAARDRAFT_40949 [Jaapia argillacea MUCL 33604]|uniref:Uncharacterized protein n=1 Tax=Jaapia argillacea MUCL 33604 TaxID=933084 RepID=A0A067PCY8_9AGAM|nr:hypothetical protein JAAARDRAFT_40949 [Jaapia argillacea MUCL 33604]